MKRIMMICIAALTCLAFASCGQQSESDAVMACYNAASKLIEDGDYDAARQMIEEAISTYGDGALLDSLLRKMEPQSEPSSETTAPDETTSRAASESGSITETDTDVFDTYDIDTFSDFDTFLLDEYEDFSLEYEDELTNAYPQTEAKKGSAAQTTAANEIDSTSRSTEKATTTRVSQTQTTAAAVSSGTQTISKDAALELAKSYVSQTVYSRSQIIDQMKKNGVSQSDAVYAADHCGANWNEQAIKAARACAAVGDELGYGFSADSLTKALRLAGFSDSEAAYAVSQAGIDWNAQAIKSAKKEASSDNGYSYDQLKNYLQKSGFSENAAVYAASHAEIDWNAQAVKAAKMYLRAAAGSGGFSDDRMVRQLEKDGFTYEQAVYGAAGCGADWNEQAVLSAKAELQNEPDLSDAALLERLTSVGFSESEARYALTRCR